MSRILTYIATRNGRVQRSALEVLTRSRELAAAHGKELQAVIMAPEAAAHVDEVQRYGADKIYLVEHPGLGRPVNRLLVDALAQVVAYAQPEVVTFASDESVKDMLGALAVRTDAAALADVSVFECTAEGVEALRPVMASKVLARTRAAGARVLISVRPGAYAAVEAPTEAKVERIPLRMEEQTPRQVLREILSTADGMVDLTEADIVVAAGRGVKDEQGKHLIEELAAVLHAGVGATRTVVESGLFPPNAQIGQTGKVVSPSVYFAVGISGAIQHVAGMADSRVIVAINKDPNAPIFQYATYGIVGDLYEVLPPLIKALSNGREV